MLDQCRTPYYLALNQDVILQPQYILRLCDRMDADPNLSLTSGVILFPPTANDDFASIVHSRGLVFPRVRYYFQLGMGRPLSKISGDFQFVPGVDGAAMMLNVQSCRRAALDGREIFAESFFAYAEEIDLALRLARLGLTCGVEPMALAVHRGKGSGGYAQAAIRARSFANHWLVTLRNDPWSLMLREIPYILRGELQYWLPQYLRHPPAFLLALGILLREALPARRFYRAFERRFGPTLTGLLRYKRDALAAVRADRQ